MSDLTPARPSAAAARPRVSFVAAWQGCPDMLSRRLRVWDRWAANGIDVVVVCSCPPADRNRIERAHPDVLVVSAPADEDLRTLRQRGIAAARGDIVVIVDDTVGRTSSWRDHLPLAFGGNVPAAQAAPWVGIGRAASVIDDATVP